MRRGSVRRAAPARSGIAMLAACAAALAACDSPERSAEPAAPVQLDAPSGLVQEGTLTLCSDIAYPPMEFMDDAGEPAGADIEIAERLAEMMDVDATFVNTAFDDVLTKVSDGECDAAISSITNTEERREVVAFVNYLSVGQSLMVSTANPKDIESLDDLSGAKVAVQAGTVSEEFLREHARTTSPPPAIVTFAKDTDATAALADGRADAYLGDSPVVAYHIGQEALTYAFAGDPINAEPLGIAVARDAEQLHEELEQGIAGMYDDGSMQRILRRWKLEDFALQQ